MPGIARVPDATRAYLVNGLAMLATWTAWRVLLFQAYLWLLWDTWPDLRGAIPNPQRSLLVVVPAILLGLNLVWFSAIVRGARKVLYRATTAP